MLPAEQNLENQPVEAVEPAANLLTVRNIVITLSTVSLIAAGLLTYTLVGSDKPASTSANEKAPPSPISIIQGVKKEPLHLEKPINSVTDPRIFNPPELRKEEIEDINITPEPVKPADPKPDEDIDEPVSPPKPKPAADPRPRTVVPPRPGPPPNLLEQIRAVKLRDLRDITQVEKIEESKSELAQRLRKNRRDIAGSDSDDYYDREYSSDYDCSDDDLFRPDPVNFTQPIPAPVVEKIKPKAEPKNQQPARVFVRPQNAEPVPFEQIMENIKAAKGKPSAIAKPPKPVVDEPVVDLPPVETKEDTTEDSEPHMFNTAMLGKAAELGKRLKAAEASKPKSESDSEWSD